VDAAAPDGVALGAALVVREAVSVVVVDSVQAGAMVLQEEAATVADTEGHGEDQRTARTRSRPLDPYLSGRLRRLLLDLGPFSELPLRFSFS
jgi:hypothetical protein